jgi:hypothetical protein
MSTQFARIFGVAAVSAVVGAGCSNFTTVTTPLSTTLTTFDNRAPAGLEEVFATCSEPLVLEAGDSSVDLRGTCDSAGDLTSAQAQLIYGLMAAEMPLALDAAIPSHLTTIVQTLDGFPWPVQNCEVVITADAVFEDLALYDLDASWETRGGDPALRIDFDFGSSQRVGHLDVNVNVNCPSSLSEWLINTFKSRVIDELDGRHPIRASGMDLDLWVHLDHTTSDITGDLELQFQVDGVDLGIDWSLIDEIDGSEVEEEARATMESETEAMLRDSLGMLADTTADLVAMAIPSGHKVCSLTEAAGQLRLRTDSPGIGSCLLLHGGLPTAP